MITFKEAEFYYFQVTISGFRLFLAHFGSQNQNVCSFVQKQQSKMLKIPSRKKKRLVRPKNKNFASKTCEPSGRRSLSNQSKKTKDTTRHHKNGMWNINNWTTQDTCFFLNYKIKLPLNYFFRLWFARLRRTNAVEAYRHCSVLNCLFSNECRWGVSSLHRGDSQSWNHSCCCCCGVETVPIIKPHFLTKTKCYNHATLHIRQIKFILNSFLFFSCVMFSKMFLK